MSRYMHTQNRYKMDTVKIVKKETNKQTSTTVLCKTVIYNTAQNSSSNIPSYPPDSITAQQLSIGGEGVQRLTTYHTEIRPSNIKRFRKAMTGRRITSYLVGLGEDLDVCRQLHPYQIQLIWLCTTSKTSCTTRGIEFHRDLWSKPDHF